MPLDIAEFLVGAAIRAPSLHNTQPWRFVYRGDGTIELWADPARRLPATDPAGRELVISCGAALATLALGVRWLGHQPTITRCPEPAHPTLLARVSSGPRHPARRWELDMFAAVIGRHTHRGRFDDEPVAPALLARLLQLAHHGPSRAYLIDEGAGLHHVARWTADADRAQRSQPSLQAELSDWVRLPGSRRRDGVTPDAADTGPGQLAPRFGRQPDAAARPDAWCPAATVLLATGRDDLPAWLSAGEALQRMLLHAAHHNVYASIHSQPLEVPSTRARLAALLGGGFPQMLLQLGHADGEATSPRRPPAQVLLASGYQRP